MNLTHHEAVTYLQNFSTRVLKPSTTVGEIAVLPPFTSLHAVQSFVDRNDVKIAYGGQDVSPASNGPYTGDVAGPMLASLGCTYVLAGHSERRQHHSESDGTVQAKVQAAFRHGLAPILCVGEGLEVRQRRLHVDFTLAQVRSALAEAREHEARSAVIAYEPVWAIGTGEEATPADVQEVCAAIREQLKEMFSLELSGAIRVIYGGSVTVMNIRDILAGPDVDGALVGGASLNPESFAAICNAAMCTNL
jgi:triosephosphate isomerase